MGNRAVITTKEGKIGIYLHWNGGRDSVEAFLKYCEMQKFAKPEEDLTYSFARLTQVICNFFGGTGCCGIGPLNMLDCDNYDNGVYIIENWKIIGRDFFQGKKQNDYDIIEMLNVIDKAQPESYRLGLDKIKEYLSKEEKK